MVVPLVLLVLLAGVEVALVARTQLEVVSAAREGAREAAAVPDPSRAVAAVRHALPAPHDGRARVAVRRPHVVGKPAEVTVTVPYRVAAPLFGGFMIELKAKAVMRVER